MQSAIIKGSISDLARQSRQSIARSFVNAEMVIIVDVSGSMGAQDARGGKSRYEVALEELASLQEAHPGEIAVLAFSSTVEFCPHGQPAHIGGGTDLTQALRFAKMADVPGMRFVVVSDGRPDNQVTALAAARQFQSRIDTVYVGPETGRGRDFLAKLASASGGKSVAEKVDLLGKSVQKLTS